MPIKPDDMLAISLPAAYWDFLLYAARKAPTPHDESDPVIRALAGQMKAHSDRAKAADDLAAQAESQPAEPAAPAAPPKPPGKRKRAA